MTPVVKALQADESWETKVIVTGQHREMLDQVLSLFEILPDYDLNIMQPVQTLTGITVAVLKGLEEVFTQWRPDYLLVHGDTTTAFAAALAGFYHQIPVGHVEAGLRTGTLDNPFPEEGNRKLTDHIASLFFAPTAQAADNLLAEGVDAQNIYVTGNTVIDALHLVVKPEYQFQTPQLSQLDMSKPVILVTAHRRENWGEPLRNICQALRRIALAHSVEIVFAMHKNPRLQAVIEDALDQISNVHLIDSPDYFEFANLLNRCTFLVTDSGGIQEEGVALGKPILVLRDFTERPEGIETGAVKLVGTDEERVFLEINRLLVHPQAYQVMADADNPYGDGKAAARIKNILKKYM